MITIYKYKVDVYDSFELELPSGSKILSLQIQNGLPCLWVLINTDAQLVKRHFEWFATGQEVTIHKQYIGTLQDNCFVWHLFEKYGDVT